MPPSGECLRRIALAAVMVDDFKKKEKISSFFTGDQR
jgi:hypothetical protein